MQNEAKISKAIERLMEMNRAWAFNVHGHGSQKVGVPDLLFCMCGKFVAVEVKDDSPTSKQGNLSPIQKVRCRDIVKAGGIAFVARSVYDVNAFLKGDYIFKGYEIMYIGKKDAYIPTICSLYQWNKWIASIKETE